MRGLNCPFGERFHMGRSLKVERRGLGVAPIMSWTWSGRANDKAFKFQFPLASQQSLTFVVVSRMWSGPWMRFRRGPWPIQLSYQKWVVSPFLIIQRLLSSQMDLAFKMLFHVKDFLLVTFEVLGYFFLKVSAQIVSALVWNSHNLLARMTQEKLHMQIHVNLSRFNQPRSLAPHLSIYRVLGKLNVKFCFRPMITWFSRDSCAKYSRAYKRHFIFVIIEIEGYMHNRSCCDVCALRVLCQATFNSSKYGLRNSPKLQQ